MKVGEDGWMETEERKGIWITRKKALERNIGEAHKEKREEGEDYVRSTHENKTISTKTNLIDVALTERKKKR